MLAVDHNEHLCSRPAHMGKADSDAGFAVVPPVLLRMYLDLEKAHAVYTVRVVAVQLTWWHRPLARLKYAQNRAYSNPQRWNAGHHDASEEECDRTRYLGFEWRNRLEEWPVETFGSFVELDVLQLIALF